MQTIETRRLFWHRRNIAFRVLRNAILVAEIAENFLGFWVRRRLELRALLYLVRTGFGACLFRQFFWMLSRYKVIVLVLFCRRSWSCLATKRYSGFTRARRSIYSARSTRYDGFLCTFSHIHILSAARRPYNDAVVDNSLAQWRFKLRLCAKSRSRLSGLNATSFLLRDPNWRWNSLEFLFGPRALCQGQGWGHGIGTKAEATSGRLEAEVNFW